MGQPLENLKQGWRLWETSFAIIWNGPTSSWKLTVLRRILNKFTKSQFLQILTPKIFSKLYYWSQVWLTSNTIRKLGKLIYKAIRIAMVILWDNRPSDLYALISETIYEEPCRDSMLSSKEKFLSRSLATVHGLARNGTMTKYGPNKRKSTSNILNN